MHTAYALGNNPSHLSDDAHQECSSCLPSNVNLSQNALHGLKTRLTRSAASAALGMFEAPWLCCKLTWGVYLTYPEKLSEALATGHCQTVQALHSCFGAYRWRRVASNLASNLHLFHIFCTFLLLRGAGWGGRGGVGLCVCVCSGTWTEIAWD